MKPDARPAKAAGDVARQRVRTRLAIAPARDAHEAAADRAAALFTGTRSGAPRGAPASGRACAPTTASDTAPASVHAALASGGRPLDPATRTLMERRLQHPFDGVRVHDGPLAAASARDVRAHAYSVGPDIVFARGRYAPATPAGQALIAHELTHVAQARRSTGPAVLRRQQESEPPQGSGTRTSPPGAQPAAGQGARGAAPAPRPDFVFIMGQDPARTTGFYALAEQYYRVHLPAATMVTSVRTLDDLLSYVATRVTTPIGHLYIVTHANEDGTLSFGLNAADTDTHLSVNELRDAIRPAGGGASTLTGVGSRIDATTRIHIKGCDLGRTQQMVELIDEAFGGAGTVTAPTHEQVFGTDPVLERRARAQFRAQVRAAHPEPEPVDRSLRGAARQQAVTARRAAMRQREQDIQAEIAARQGEEDRLAAEAGHYEALSGPMFQRPGRQLFTARELTPQVAALYGHLSARQQRSLVQRLVAADTRSAAVARANGVFQQSGQRAYRLTRLTYTFDEPQTAAEANRLYQADFHANHFRATGTPAITRTPVTGGFTMAVSVPGRSSPPGADPFDTTRRFTYQNVSDEAALIARARPSLPNPQRYAWSVTRTHASSGITTLTVIAERVVAYLHHGSLDVGPQQHFTRPESDPSFYATSTFAPAPPAAPAGSGAPAPGPTP